MVEENDTITFVPLNNSTLEITKSETITIEADVVNKAHFVSEVCVILWDKIEW